jgi:hypothetical protein
LLNSCITKLCFENRNELDTFFNEEYANPNNNFLDIKVVLFKYYNPSVNFNNETRPPYKDNEGNLHYPEYIIGYYDKNDQDEEKYIKLKIPYSNYKEANNIHIENRSNKLTPVGIKTNPFGKFLLDVTEHYEIGRIDQSQFFCLSIKNVFEGEEYTDSKILDFVDINDDGCLTVTKNKVIREPIEHIKNVNIKKFENFNFNDFKFNMDDDEEDNNLRANATHYDVNEKTMFTSYIGEIKYRKPDHLKIFDSFIYPKYEEYLIKRYKGILIKNLGITEKPIEGEATVTAQKTIEGEATVTAQGTIEEEATVTAQKTIEGETTGQNEGTTDIKTINSKNAFGRIVDENNQSEGGRRTRYKKRKNSKKSRGKKRK